MRLALVRGFEGEECKQAERKTPPPLSTLKLKVLKY